MNKNHPWRKGYGGMKSMKKDCVRGFGTACSITCSENAKRNRRDMLNGRLYARNIMDNQTLVEA